MTTLAGTSKGLNDGSPEEAQFNFLTGIAVDDGGVVYVADKSNHRIRKISPRVLTGNASGQASGDQVINLIANDGQGRTVNHTLTITIVDVSNPVFTSPTTATVRENITATVYTAVAADASTLTYSLGSGNDETLFDINAGDGKVTFKSAPDFENPADANTDNDYEIEVKADDGLRVSAQLVTNSVTDQNETPIFTSSPVVTVNDNVVYNYEITTTDPEGDEVSVSGDQLPVWLTVEEQTANGVSTYKLTGDATGYAGSQEITLTAQDSHGASSTQTFSITIRDVTAPVFTSSTTANFVENGTGTAYTAVAIDANNLHYNLARTNDGDLFNINSQNGEVTFKLPPDFENPLDVDGNNTYVFQVSAGDNTQSASQTVTITVTNVDDTAPVFTSPLTVDFVENGTGTVYTAAATDANPITFSLGNNYDEALFEIASGVITFKAAPNFEYPLDSDANNTYMVEVLANDGIHMTSHLVTIRVTDQGEPPAFISTPVTSVNEDELYKYDILVKNANGDNLTISAPVLPEWLSFKEPNTVTTFVGSGLNFPHTDGPANDATFRATLYLDFDPQGNLYVVDADMIRKITPAGVVSTLAGSHTPGYQDGTGTNARFNLIRGMAVDASGNVYVTDGLNYRIRKITPEGVVSTLAGSGTSQSVDGMGTAASFRVPFGLDVDSQGNLYTIEQGTSRIRKISPEGNVTTVFVPASANRLVQPIQLIIDDAGIFHASDARGVNRLKPGGSFELIASLNDRGQLVKANNGQLYMTLTQSHGIHRISPQGTISQIAGGANPAYADGVGANAAFSYPFGLALDARGNLFVADAGNYRIRKVLLQPELEGDPVGQAGTHNVSLLAEDGNGVQAIQDFTINVISSDKTPPSIVSLSPAKGSTDADPGANLVVTFDEPVFKGVGNIKIGRRSNLSLLHKIDINSAGVSINGNTLTIDPPADLPTGEELVVMIGKNAIKDGSDNVIGKLFGLDTWKFTMKAQDVTSPSIVSLSPAKGSTDADPGVNLVVTFDEPVFKDLGNIKIGKRSDLSLLYKIDINSAAVSINGNRVTIDPPADLPAGEELVVMIGKNAIKDGSDNVIGKLFGLDTWKFKMKTQDVTAPSIVSMSPAKGSTDADPGANLVVTFDEPVFKGVGNIKIGRRSNLSLLHKIDINSAAVSVNGNTLTIDPPADLPSGEVLVVLIGKNGIKDGSDNVIGNLFGLDTWKFTMKAPDVTAPSIVSLSPAKGSTDAAPGANLVVTFDEPVFKGVGNIKIGRRANLSLLHKIDINSAAVSINGNTVTIDLPADLPTGEEIVVLIGKNAIKDGSDNVIGNLFGLDTWKFTAVTQATEESSDGQALTLDNKQFDAKEEIVNEISLEAYPNPAVEKVVITMSSDIAGRGVLTMMDIKGQYSKQLFDGELEAKEDKRVEVRVDDLPNGLYIIHMRTAQKARTLKLLVRK